MRTVDKYLEGVFAEEAKITAEKYADKFVVNPSSLTGIKKSPYVKKYEKHIGKMKLACPACGEVNEVHSVKQKQLCEAYLFENTYKCKKCGLERHWHKTIEGVGGKLVVLYLPFEPWRKTAKAILDEYNHEKTHLKGKGKRFER